MIRNIPESIAVRFVTLLFAERQVEQSSYGADPSVGVTLTNQFDAPSLGDHDN